MTTNLERIEYELKLAGYNLDQEEFDFVNECGKSAYEICKVFAEQGHSGMSASITLGLLKKLLIDEDPLSELTDNPDEWLDVSDMCNEIQYQSKRDFSCFSTDLKSYWDIDEIEQDEHGNNVKIMHELKHYKV